MDRSAMDQVRRSAGEALWGMCAADAMSMPVHWYYTVQDIKNDFGGWIACFQSPRSRHPSSILTLSNTAGSGRSRSSVQRPPVVGSVILHDKLKFWKLPGGSVHYHQGLPAGGNTLNMLCTLRVARTLTEGGSSSVGGSGSVGGSWSAADRLARAAVLADYVRFMTTPGSHDDTYAESFHRAFFSDWQETRPTSPSEVLEFAERRYKEKMSGLIADSQLDAIGCLPMAIPFLLLSAHATEDQAVTAAVEFVRLTHPHPRLDGCVSLYARALHAALNGACIRQLSEAALRSPALDVWDTCQHYMHRASRFPGSSEERLQVHQSAVAALGLACYTKGALSSLFYLAHEFHDDLRGGILANTNCGGENCNRGAALGALLGAGRVGGAVPQEWKEGLVNAREIRAILENM
ncbi:uncharacterized protein LOC118223460 isoform X2 [Anguilla anguilla]|uniref:uncharacterized protein LOC118223460 isoform X2 n=1 Tax=Anguilla anguilla TaxID=7936 RepID=UPI0015B12DCA|nr:uncharacterized protein LOC118223460 isoform X2 [Anguilla anguilla]